MRRRGNFAPRGSRDESQTSRTRQPGYVSATQAFESTLLTDSAGNPIAVMLSKTPWNWGWVSLLAALLLLLLLKLCRLALLLLTSHLLLLSQLLLPSELLLLS